MTTSGRCGARSRRLGGYGLKWGKFSRRTTPRQRSAQSSTRQLCSRSSSTAARHRTSPRPYWRCWRGSTSGLHTGWLRNISPGEDQTRCGSTRPQKTCSRSAGCTLSRTILASGGRQFFCTWWTGQSSKRVWRESGEGDRRRDSGGGSRRCAWTTKMQTELENRGTLVGSIDGIRSALLSGGVGFAWNVGEAFGPSQGAAVPPPCGDCTKTLAYLFCKGNASGGWKSWGTKV